MAALRDAVRRELGAEPLAKHGGDRRSEDKQVRNTNLKTQTDTSSYKLARLQRDRPDLAAIPLNFLMAATSEEDQRALAWSLNADRRHLSKELRQQRAVELRQQGKSYRAIGEQLGVDPKTVHADVKAATVENSTVQLPERVVSKDGKERPATVPAPSEDEVQTAREFIIDALRRKYSPLARGQLYRDAARIAGASGIKRAAFDAALDAMLEAGSVREHINHHGAREYHFADVVGRLERGAEQGGESAAPEEATPAPVQTSGLVPTRRATDDTFILPPFP